jgi:hypothetical protein
MAGGCRRFENPADTTVVSEELLMHLKQVIFTYFQNVK